MNYRLASAVAAVLATSPTHAVWAQATGSSGNLEEVIVTAQRRSENLQDVPLSIQALSGDTLKDMKAATIDDFVKFLPSVSTANLGPGQSNIYMRGLSIGALGTQGQASVGQWPNVAVYLDEQSTQIPGRNLDVYAADLERIEVLEGPQGTLFGAGAQAGVLRYITNKPDLKRTEFNVTAGYATTAHGNDSNNLEAVMNLPLIADKLAMRVVVYNDNRGGYIDNVGSTFTRRGTDLGFAQFTGGVVPEDSVVINNYDIEADDINSVNYKGVRAGLKWQINDDWDALLTQTFQEMDANGVFYQMPNGSEGQKLKDYQVTLFNTGHTHDRFSNTALVVNGKVGTLDFVYSGAYLSRDSEQVQDYTNYARGVYGAYYQCTGYSGASVDKCYSPSSTWHDVTDNTNQSHEFRLSSPTDWRLRFVGGLFWEKRELNDQTDWLYKSMPECSSAQPDNCFLSINPAATPKFESASLNNPGQRNSKTGFIDDFKRTYTQSAAFASVDFDILENLTLTVGTRYYKIKNEMLGGNVGSFYCKVYAGDIRTDFSPCSSLNPGTYGAGLNAQGFDKAPYGTNLDEQDPHDDTADGFKSRVNLSWKVTGDTLLYATWSEGYRPGGFNRGFNCYLKDTNGVNQWCTPKEYKSDDLTNIEAGWKTTLFDRVIFNGAIYQEKWQDVQTGVFAPQLGLGNLTISLNGPEYEVKGIEMQFTASVTDNFTLQGAASYNKSELTNSPQLMNNNPDSPTFGEPVEEACVGSPCTVVPIVNVYGKKGQELANSPKLQWNLRARYDWTMADYNPFATFSAQFQDDSLSNATLVNQYKMPSWTTFDASIGVNKDEWNAELYVINLTDENKSVFTSAAQFIVAEVPMRPRTIGLRFGYKFGQ